MSGPTKPAASHHWKRQLAVKKDSAAANRTALKRMSTIEFQTGLTEAEIDAWHADQRKFIRAKYGLKDRS